MLTTASEIAGIVGTLVALVALIVSLASHGGSNPSDAESSLPSSPTLVTVVSTTPPSQGTALGNATPGAAATSSPTGPALVPVSRPTSQHPLGYALLLSLAILLGTSISITTIKFVIIDDEPSGCIMSLLWIASGLFLVVGPVSIAVYVVHYLRHNSLTTLGTASLYVLWGVAAAAGVTAGIAAVIRRHPHSLNER